MAPTVLFLTTTGANNFTVPNDWANGNNTIEVMGAGGGGGDGDAGANIGSGAGGGGGYSKITNLTLAVGASISYTIATGGARGSSGATAVIHFLMVLT